MMLFCSSLQLPCTDITESGETTTLPHVVGMWRWDGSYHVKVQEATLQCTHRANLSQVFLPLIRLH